MFRDEVPANSLIQVTTFRCVCDLMETAPSLRDGTCGGDTAMSPGVCRSQPIRQLA